MPMKDNPTVTVLVLVEAGSKYEKKEKNGLSHFLEHMCFKGTASRPSNTEISTELDNLGSHYNAFTGQEYTGYYAKAEANHLDKLLDIISDLYLNPLFPEKEIEKEKGVIIEEINMYEDLPQRKVEMVFEELLYGDQPAGWSIAGSKDNIKNMQRSDFINYRSQYYVPSATTVILAGNLDEKKAVKSAIKIFGRLPKKAKGKKKLTIERQDKPQIKIFKKETDQTHLILGVRTFDVYDKRNKVLDVLVGILSGGMSARLFRTMRDEMGICYYVRAAANATTDTGQLTIAIGADSKRVLEAITALLNELKKLKTDLVSVEELNKVKQYLIGTMYLGLESSDSLAEFYGGQEIMNKKIKQPEQVKADIESVTASEIQKLAREILVDKNLNLAIVGNFTDPKQFMDILGL